MKQEHEDLITIILMWIVLLLCIYVFILLISSVLAETIYSGEEVIIPIDYEIVNCSITNSTYNLTGLNLSWSGNNIVISTSPYYQPDNLTISCWVIKYDEVIEKHYSGGGGCLTIWECNEWSDCINGNQTRNCSKVKSYCYAKLKDKPIEIQSCIIPIQNDTEEPEPDIEPIEDEEKFNWLLFGLIAGIILIIVIGSVVIIYYLKTHKKE